jgi:phage terminase small subunit
VKLTEKQKRFADYYIASGNAEDAAKKAGSTQEEILQSYYKVLQSNKLLKNAINRL